MDPFTAALIAQGVSTGVGVIGGLFGGGGDAPGIPQEILDLALSEFNRQDFTGFMPDKGAFDESLRSDLDDVFARLPGGIEAFNSDLAARGIYGSGEAPGKLYQDVYAPVARAGTSAVAKANLGFAQATQQGNIAAEQLRFQRLQQLINLNQSNTELQYRDYLSGQQGAQNFWNQIGQGAGNVGNIYLAKSLYGNQNQTPDVMY